MSTHIEDWQRAGFEERNGKLERIDDANRTVPKTEGTDPARERDQSALIQKQQNPDHQRTERQALTEAAVNHEAGISRGYETDREQFRVSIVFRFSDRRRTDLSGKLDTILDCLVHARRRLLGDDTRDSRKRGNVRAGKRGGNNNHRKVVEETVPF